MRPNQSKRSSSTTTSGPFWSVLSRVSRGRSEICGKPGGCTRSCGVDGDELTRVLEFRIQPPPAKSLQTFGSSPNDKERYTWIVPSRYHGECHGAGARPARSARQLSLESS